MNTATKAGACRERQNHTIQFGDWIALIRPNHARKASGRPGKPIWTPIEWDNATMQISMNLANNRFYYYTNDISDDTNFAPSEHHNSLNITVDLVPPPPCSCAPAASELDRTK